MCVAMSIYSQPVAIVQNRLNSPPLRRKEGKLYVRMARNDPAPGESGDECARHHLVAKKYPRLIMCHSSKVRCAPSLQLQRVAGIGTRLVWEGCSWALEKNTDTHVVVDLPRCKDQLAAVRQYLDVMTPHPDDACVS